MVRILLRTAASFGEFQHHCGFAGERGVDNMEPDFPQSPGKNFDRRWIPKSDRAEAEVKMRKILSVGRAKRERDLYLFDCLPIRLIWADDGFTGCGVVGDPEATGRKFRITGLSGFRAAPFLYYAIKNPDIWGGRMRSSYRHIGGIG